MEDLKKKRMEDPTVVPVTIATIPQLRMTRRIAGEYELKESERVEFIKYEDRGHSYVFCSDDAKEYRESLNEDYTAYVEAHGGKYNAEIKQEFMSANLDKAKCFEPDKALMDIILQTYDEVCVDG